MIPLCIGLIIGAVACLVERAGVPEWAERMLYEALCTAMDGVIVSTSPHLVEGGSNDGTQVLA